MSDHRDVGVIVVGPDDWSDRRMARHQIHLRMGRTFQVLWMNPAHRFRDSLQIARAGKTIVEADDILVYTPEFWLPRRSSPSWLARFVWNRRLARARRVLADRGCRRFVLYLWRPHREALSTLDAFDVNCYHMSDEYSFSESEQPLSDVERQVISSVDQVFIHPSITKSSWATSG